MLGNRAIYHDGWVACTTPPIAPWNPNSLDVDPITGYRWELYHVDEDFTQADDLAERYPDRLKDLQIRFYAEAARYNVLPIDNGRTGRLDPANRPSLTRGRTSFTFIDGMSRIPEGAFAGHQEQVLCDLRRGRVACRGASGMIITQGGLFGGYALYLEKGRPVFHYNFVDVAHTEIAAKDQLGLGKHAIGFAFTYDGGGIGKGGSGCSRLTAGRSPGDGSRGLSPSGSPWTKGSMSVRTPARRSISPTTSPSGSRGRSAR